MDRNGNLKTEDYEPLRIACGKLDAVGLTFTLVNHEELKGQHGIFWRMKAVANSGRKDELNFVLDYSSGKLHALMAHNLDILINQCIKVSGRGSGFDRQYTVTIVENPKEKIEEISRVNLFVEMSKKETL